MKRLILTFMVVLFLACPVWAGNDVSGKTWVLDTVGSISTSWVKMIWIVWTGIGTDGDDLAIHEKESGKLIVKLKGIASCDMLVSFPGNSGKTPGFYLTTLDSGEVLVRVD